MLPWIPSQAVAAAVTEEVSLIAVPAKRPKPSLLSPSAAPRAGKISAAATLNRKMTEMDCATSSSDASMTGAVAAMALPPQIEEPTPTRIALYGAQSQRFIQDECDDQRGGDGGDDDGQGLFPFRQDLGQVHAEAEEDDGCLQDLFGCIVDAGREGLLFCQDEGDDHPRQDGEDRPADDRDGLPGKPGGNGDDQAEQESGAVFS